MKYSSINTQTGELYYQDGGKGEVIVLLHGYQADSRIWDKLVPYLESSCRLIIPDLPGHGKSKLIKRINTVEHLAETVHHLVTSLQISRFSIAGHSMGGYVCLAYAERYPQFLNRIFLINSHPFPDRMYRVMERNREAELIVKGKKMVLLKTFLKDTFLPQNIEKCKVQIAHATHIAMEQDDQGVMADIVGMMARPDRSSLIERVDIPIVIAYSKWDKKIEIERLNEIDSDNLDLVEMNNCGHLSILEAPALIASIITRSSVMA